MFSPKLDVIESQVDGFRYAGRYDDVARLLQAHSKFGVAVVTRAHSSPALVQAYRLTVAGEMHAAKHREEEARKAYEEAISVSGGTYLDAHVLGALLLLGHSSVQTPEEGPASPGTPLDAKIDGCDAAGLLSRALGLALDGVEHATQYRLHLRLRGLHTLSTLLQGRSPAAVASVAVKSAAPLPPALLCDLQDLAVCNLSWAVVAELSRRKAGAGGSESGGSAGSSSTSLVSGSGTINGSNAGGGTALPSEGMMTNPLFSSSSSSGVRGSEGGAASSFSFARHGVVVTGSSTTCSVSIAASTTGASPVLYSSASSYSVSARVSFLDDPGVAATDSSGLRGIDREDAGVPEALAAHLRAHGASVTCATYGASGPATASAAAVYGAPPLPSPLAGLDAQTSGLVTSCVARIPVLLQNLGDATTAVRAGLACLSWAGPVAAHLSQPVKAAVGQCLLRALFAGAGSLAPWAAGSLAPSTAAPAAGSPRNGPITQLALLTASFEHSQGKQDGAGKGAGSAPYATTEGGGGDDAPTISEIFSSTRSSGVITATSASSSSSSATHGSGWEAFKAARLVCAAAAAAVPLFPQDKRLWAAYAYGLGIQALLSGPGGVTPATFLHALDTGAPLAAGATFFPAAAVTTSDVPLRSNAALPSALFSAVEEAVTLPAAEAGTTTASAGLGAASLRTSPLPASLALPGSGEAASLPPLSLSGAAAQAGSRASADATRSGPAAPPDALLLLLAARVAFVRCNDAHKALELAERAAAAAAATEAPGPWWSALAAAANETAAVALLATSAAAAARGCAASPSATEPTDAPALRRAVTLLIASMQMVAAGGAKGGAAAPGAGGEGAETAPAASAAGSVRSRSGSDASLDSTRGGETGGDGGAASVGPLLPALLAKLTPAYWHLPYHSAIAYLRLGYKQQAAACAGRALDLCLAAEGSVTSPVAALPWALAAAVAGASGKGPVACAKVLSRALVHHPNDVTLRLLEAVTAEALVLRRGAPLPCPAGAGSSSSSLLEGEDAESLTGSGSDPETEDDAASYMSGEEDEGQEGVTAPSASTSALVPSRSAVLSTAVSLSGSDLLALFADAAFAAEGVAWAFIKACAEGHTRFAAASAVDAPTLLDVAGTTPDLGLPAAAPGAAAAVAPAVITRAVTALVHTVRLAAETRAFATGHAALTAADALVNALSAPLRVLYDRRGAFQSGSSSSVSTGAAAVPAAPALPPRLAPASASTGGQGLYVPVLTGALEAESGTTPTDPALRAATLWAAGELHLAAAATAAAQSHFAAAVAACPSHAPSLVRLAETSLSTAVALACGSATDPRALLGAAVHQPLLATLAATRGLSSPDALPAPAAAAVTAPLDRAAAYAAAALRAAPGSPAAWAVQARIAAAGGDFVASADAAVRALAATRTAAHTGADAVGLLPPCLPLWC